MSEHAVLHDIIQLVNLKVLHFSLVSTCGLYGLCCVGCVDCVDRMSCVDCKKMCLETFLIIFYIYKIRLVKSEFSFYEIGRLENEDVFICHHVQIHRCVQR